MPTLKSLNQLLDFLNLCQHAKNQLMSSVHSGDKVKFRAQRLDWPKPFLIMANQKVFDQPLMFVNLYQYGTNYAVSSICSGEMVDLKILKSDWLIPFWPLFLEQDFA